MLAAARTGGPLFVRTVVLRAVFLVAAAVAARLGDADLAAYHVSFQVWMLLALAADALAIAGMALLGRYLGAGDRVGRPARAPRGSCGSASAMGVVLGLLRAGVACRGCRSLFSSDPLVRSLIAASLVVAALQQPLSSPVFVLDGVLIGAGDGRWLAGAGLVMLVAFLPAAWLVLDARPRRRRAVVGAHLVHGRARRAARLAGARRRWLRTSADAGAAESAALGDAGG